MPDQRRRLRRPSTARPLSRAITHLLVIGLVAVSSAFGIAAALPDDRANDFALVSQARGAAGTALIDRRTTYELIPDPVAPDPMLSRRQIQFTADPTPLPTPVAPPPPPPDPTPRPQPPPAPPAPPPVVAGSGQLAWPVPGGSISQYYHAGHLALDIAASSGSTVVAADSGVVTSAGWRSNGGGLVIVIDHGNGIVTAYNHLGSLWVSPGQAVTRGQRIAGVGCTGVCTGPHVHFEVIVGGTIVNPLRYL